jgi:hypothetical protein
MPSKLDSLAEHEWPGQKLSAFSVDVEIFEKWLFVEAE